MQLCATVIESIQPDSVFSFVGRIELETLFQHDKSLKQKSRLVGSR